MVIFMWLYHQSMQYVGRSQLATSRKFGSLLTVSSEQPAAGTHMYPTRSNFDHFGGVRAWRGREGAAGASTEDHKLQPATKDNTGVL